MIIMILCRHHPTAKTCIFYWSCNGMGTLRFVALPRDLYRRWCVKTLILGSVKTIIMHVCCKNDSCKNKFVTAQIFCGEEVLFFYRYSCGGCSAERPRRPTRSLQTHPTDFHSMLLIINTSMQGFPYWVVEQCYFCPKYFDVVNGMYKAFDLSFMKWTTLLRNLGNGICALFPSLHCTHSEMVITSCKPHEMQSCVWVDM